MPRTAKRMAARIAMRAGSHSRGSASVGRTVASSMTAMREGADAGLPATIADPGGEAATAFEALAREVEMRKPRVRAHPELVVR